MNYVYYPDYLEHYGILGQKWGIRRYQNDDGSLTEAGRKHYAADKYNYKSIRNDSRRQKAYRDYNKQLLNIEKSRNRVAKMHKRNPTDSTERVLNTLDTAHRMQRDIMDDVFRNEMKMSTTEINYRKARDDWERYTKQDNVHRMLFGAIPTAVYGLYRSYGTAKGRELSRTYDKAAFEYRYE